MMQEENIKSSNIPDRIEIVRVFSGKNKREFAKIIGIHPNSYTNYIYGKRSIPLEKLHKISDLFDISLQWLIDGTGEMHKSILVLNEPETLYKADVNKLPAINTVPASIDEINAAGHNEIISINIDTNSNFIIEPDSELTADATPFIRAGDKLICSCGSEIKEGDLAAVRFKNDICSINVCFPHTANNDLIILRSLSADIPTIEINRNQIVLYKIICVLKQI